MAGFRGPSSYSAYAGVAGADLENAPQGPVPFTSPFGLPVGRPQIWKAAGTQPGAATGGVPGKPVQEASGNPDVASVPSFLERSPYAGMRFSHIEGNPPGQLPYGAGQNPPSFVSGIPQFGSYSARVLNPEQERAAPRPGRPVGGANDKLTTLDRHGMMKVGYENSGRNSGQTDPPLDGPARPSLWLVQRSLSYQQGTDATAATDDLSRDYARNAEGMYVGTQGDGWSRVYGGVPGLYQEYGSYEGLSPSSPMTGNDTSTGIHSPVGQGQPGDGPHDLWAGPPHGLHSPTLPTYSQTIGRYMDIPQMARPRIDRPSNSPIAGQSYSQTVQSQGQTGFNKAAQKAGGAAFNNRVRNGTWRGRSGG
jgi:hypothetical protein